VVPDDAVPDDTAGIRQAVRQLATCELQVIMQLVVVEVSGVARPVRGGVTVGMEVCASVSQAPAQIIAAAARIVKRRMTVSTNQATWKPTIFAFLCTPAVFGPRCTEPLSASSRGTKPAGRRRRSPGSGTLQTRHGVPAPPQVHARLLSPQSLGRSPSFSQTQPVLFARLARGGGKRRVMSMARRAIPRTARELRTVFLRCKRIAG
jgi:hypothetical protein